MTIKIYKLITANNSTTPSYECFSLRPSRTLHKRDPAGPRSVYYYIKWIYARIFTYYIIPAVAHIILYYIYTHIQCACYSTRIRSYIHIYTIYGARGGCGRRKMRWYKNVKFELFNKLIENRDGLSLSLILSLYPSIYLSIYISLSTRAGPIKILSSWWHIYIYLMD